MNGQLALFELERRDPFDCPNAARAFEDRVVCTRNGGEVYVNCRTSQAGDPPKCVWEPIDNSPEAMARRREWLKAGK